MLTFLILAAVSHLGRGQTLESCKRLGDQCKLMADGTPKPNSTPCCFGTVCEGNEYWALCEAVPPTEAPTEVPTFTPTDVPTEALTSNPDNLPVCDWVLTNDYSDGEHLIGFNGYGDYNSYTVDECISAALADGCSIANIGNDGDCWCQFGTISDGYATCASVPPSVGGDYCSCQVQPACSCQFEENAGWGATVPETGNFGWCEYASRVRDRCPNCCNVSLPTSSPTRSRGGTTSALADERCATYDGETYDGNPLATSPSIFQFSEVKLFLVLSFLASCYR
jgi:hypothetical protein